MMRRRTPPTTTTDDQETFSITITIISVVASLRCMVVAWPERASHVEQLTNG
jgi:hypothetical protein